MVRRRGRGERAPSTPAHGLRWPPSGRISISKSWGALEAAFLSASQENEQQRRADEAEKNRRLAEAERQRAEEAEARIAAMMIAGRGTQVAKDKTPIAESRRLAPLSEAERDKRLDRALLLAVDAHDLLASKDHDTANMREARNSLFGALVVRPGLTAFLHSDEGFVSSVAFGPDGKTLAVGYRIRGGDCGGVVLWDTARRERLQEMPLAVTEGYVNDVAFSPDGKTLAAGWGDDVCGGGVVQFDIDLTSWRRQAGSIANRNLSRAEWQEYFPGQPYRKTFD